MKNFVSHKVFFLTVFMFISTESLADNQILPVPKPTPDLETKISVNIKKKLYPQKKPTIQNIQ